MPLMSRKVAHLSPVITLGRKWPQIIVLQWFLKCGSWTGSGSLTWELTRSATNIPELEALRVLSSRKAGGRTDKHFFKKKNPEKKSMTHILIYFFKRLWFLSPVHSVTASTSLVLPQCLWPLWYQEKQRFMPSWSTVVHNRLPLKPVLSYNLLKYAQSLRIHGHNIDYIIWCDKRHLAKILPFL